MSTATTSRTSDDDTTSRPRWLMPLIGGVVVVAAIVVGVVLTSGDDDPGEPTLSDVPSSVDAPADGEGSQLLDLLAAGADRTFHATYEAEVTDQDVAGALTLELYRADGHVRQDSVVVAQGQEARTAAIQSPDGEVISCIQQGEWICASQQQEANDLFGSLAAQLEGQDVTTTEVTILDMAGTCYTLADETGTSELCVSSDGIPLRITASDGTALELTAFVEDVDPAVFDPPAEPQQAD